MQPSLSLGSDLTGRTSVGEGEGGFLNVFDVATSMHGRVVALGTSKAAGAPIEPQERLSIAVAHGVVGDRYSANEGHFKGFPDQEVTLVEAEDAESLGIEPLALRRNIVTRGVKLDELIGRSFRLGSATLHGMRPCLPCGYLAKHLARPGLKEDLRGGLRARVVSAGDVRVGDAVEIVAPTLDDDMRAVVNAARLVFAATVTPEGMPNVSPKGTVRVLDEHRLFFLELASPQTRKNLAANPHMELNVVDQTSRRGYRFFGRAEIHEGDGVHATAEEIVFRDDGSEYANRGAVVLTIERVLPLISPGYHGDVDEHAMRASWREKRASLDASFEAHVGRRGPHRPIL